MNQYYGLIAVAVFGSLIFAFSLLLASSPARKHPSQPKVRVDDDSLDTLRNHLTTVLQKDLGSLHQRFEQAEKQMDRIEKKVDRIERSLQNADRAERLHHELMSLLGTLDSQRADIGARIDSLIGSTSGAGQEREEAHHDDEERG